MATQPQISAAGVPTFRELTGDEMADILAHDLEQAIINMLATKEFFNRAKAMFLRTGKFGLGACYPVVLVNGQVEIKVFTSVESYRSNEKLPEPFKVDVALETGQMLEDSERVCGATTNIVRTVGVDTSTAVDRVRKEVGLEVLIPARNQGGYIVNSPTQSENRTADYQARLETRRETLAKRAEDAANQIAGEQERERIAKEAEARQSE